MGVVITPSYSAWIAIYPEFQNSISEPQFGNYVTIAESLHRNDGLGPVSTAQQQTTLLYLVIAHIAYLFGGVNGNPPNQTVGRIASAAEGSVNVQLDYGQVKNSEAFWAQTKYGAMYWQMSSVYRTMRYVGRPVPAGFAMLPGLRGPWL